MKDILNQYILDNKIENLLWFAGIILVVFLFKRYLSSLLGGLLYRFFRRFTEESEVKRFNALLLRPTSLFVVLVTVFFSFRLIRYPTAWELSFMGIHLKSAFVKLILTTLAISFTWILLRIIDFISFILKEKALLTESKMDDQLVPFIKDLLKVVIVIFSLFFILGGILQFNITSLLAGVGIGGLAIALAAQESLANLFGSFAIFLDRPFTVGDLVKVGTVQGTVEKVGFRSTRIRTLDKTFVTVPNKMMVDSFVDNLTLRTYIRVSSIIGLSYDSNPEKLRSIITDIHEYLDAREEMKGATNFVRLNDLGENSINIAIEYFVNRRFQPDFLKIKEEVNFKILEIVYKHESHFARSVKVVEVKSPK